MKTAFLILLAVVLTGCSMVQKEKKTMTGMKQPVQCSTARGDLRALNSEKVHVGQQIAQGERAVFPIGLVINTVTGEEGTDFKVATGQYNKMIDARIAEIKATCGI